MAILKLTDICKDYVQGKEPVRVLKNVNMTVEQGEYLAIMGPSGYIDVDNVTIREVTEALMDYSERLTRAEIAAIADGVKEETIVDAIVGAIVTP